MSNYTDNLEKTQQNVAPEFYVYTSGSTTERYTPYNENLTFLGNLYKTAPIKRGKLLKNINLGIIKLDITVPLSDLVAQYISNQPIEPVNVTIYRSTIDDLTSYAVFFKGSIVDVSMSNKMALVQLESKNKILLKTIPKIINQAFCNHEVFDDGCGLDELLFVREAVVSSITNNGSTIGLTYTDGSPAPEADYLKGGTVMLDADIRLITGHPSGSSINIHIPFDSRLEIGSEVELLPGCDGWASTCIHKYNNKANLLAMPYIPSSNPSTWGFK